MASEPIPALVPLYSASTHFPYNSFLPSTLHAPILLSSTKYLLYARHWLEFEDSMLYQKNIVSVLMNLTYRFENQRFVVVVVVGLFFKETTINLDISLLFFSGT